MAYKTVVLNILIKDFVCNQRCIIVHFIFLKVIYFGLYSAVGSAIPQFFGLIEGKHCYFDSLYYFFLHADDATRIILQGDEDYINANYVNVSHRHLHLPTFYITVAD